jgi:threonine/homoserine/homoserine lactone efflux protein
VIVDFAAYLGVAALVIVTPGQDTVLTIRNTLLGGRRTGVSTAGGVAAGQAVWALATSVGLAALLAASEPAFLTLRLVGAAYLVYLGAYALLSALRGASRHATDDRPDRRDRLAPVAGFRQSLISNRPLRGPGPLATDSNSEPDTSSCRDRRREISAFRQGLISNIANPKMAVFFVSLLPQFAPGGGASFAGLLLLGLLFATMTLAWLACYAFVVARAGLVLRRPTIRRAIDAVTGVVLTAFGIRLAVGSR